MLRRWTAQVLAGSLDDAVRRITSPTLDGADSGGAAAAGAARHELVVDASVDPAAAARGGRVAHWMQLQEERRRALFSEANRARSRGRGPRAIALFRELLVEDPDDLDVLLRLAPLLAREGESFEAWSMFRRACKALLASGRHEACLAAFREANRVLPFEFEGWRLTAELERKLGRERAAFETLLEGRRQFRTRFVRAQAIALLELAREIHAWDHVVVLDLARLYTQTGQTARALHLLDGALVQAAPGQLADVRRAQLHATRSPQHLWLWLRERFSRCRTSECEASTSAPVDRAMAARLP